MTLLFVALGLYALGGILALAFSRSPEKSSMLGTIGAVLGAAVGLIPAISVLGSGARLSMPLAREILFGGNLVVGLDPLSAFFAIPILVLSALGSIYGRDYMRPFARTRWLGPPQFAFNILAASLVLVVMARDALVFLFAWELMTLAAYTLVTFEHEIAATRRAGFIYLIASHIALAAATAMFLLLARHSGGFGFEAFASASKASPAFATLIFLLALVGFGIKAGFFPFHVWLPEAHAAAPSHVSAMMSGALIKIGVYGLLRVLSLLTPAGWWGTMLIVLGLLGGLVGISVGLYQKDLKRVLAYSSVENMGIVALGIGVGIHGLANRSHAVATLGMAGALLHIWNHTLMKGLMFLCAGSVLHGAGTRDLDRLGGLLKQMPRTGALMIGGAVAISALPPMNGFVSEWLLYLGLINAGLAKNVFALIAVGFLASMGAITALTFVRLIGIALLGQPRSEAARHAHESPPWMLWVMTVLFGLSICMAIVPGVIVSRLGHVFDQLLGAGVATLDAPLGTIGAINAIILGTIALIGGVLVYLISRRRRAYDSTWGCGYSAPNPRMQYVSRSFAELFAEHMIPRLLRAGVAKTTVFSIFRPRLTLEHDDSDPLTRRAYEPFLLRWAELFSRLRWLQAGSLNIYLIYILVIVVAGFAWLTIRAWGLR